MIEPLPDSKKEAYNKELVEAFSNRRTQMDYVGLCETLGRIVSAHFEKKQRKVRNTDWSRETEELFHQRALARNEQHWDRAQELNLSLIHISEPTRPY